MIKKQTKILFIILLVLDIIAIALFFSLYSYMNNQIAETVQNSDQIKTEITKQETISLMKTDIETAKSDQSTLDSFLLPQDGDVDFIKIVESLVASSSLKLEVNSVTDESSDQLTSAHAELLHVNITVTGQWKDMQYFLKLLETYPLKITINTVAFSQFAQYQVNGRKVPEWSGSLDFTVLKLNN